MTLKSKHFLNFIYSNSLHTFHLLIWELQYNHNREQSLITGKENRNIRDSAHLFSARYIWLRVHKASPHNLISSREAFLHTLKAKEFPPATTLTEEVWLELMRLQHETDDLPTQLFIISMSKSVFNGLATKPFPFQNQQTAMPILFSN